MVQLQGKTVGDGFAVKGALRHKEPLLCAQGALGRWLITRFTLLKEELPHPTSPEWQETVVWSAREPTKPMTYQNHRARLAALYERLEIFISKMTHACRIFAARFAEEAGLSDAVSPRPGLIGNDYQLLHFHVLQLTCLQCRNHAAQQGIMSLQSCQECLLLTSLLLATCVRTVIRSHKAGLMRYIASLPASSQQPPICAGVGVTPRGVCMYVCVRVQEIVRLCFWALTEMQLCYLLTGLKASILLAMGGWNKDEPGTYWAERFMYPTGVRPCSLLRLLMPWLDDLGDDVKKPDASPWAVCCRCCRCSHSSWCMMPWSCVPPAGQMSTRTTRCTSCC